MLHMDAGNKDVDDEYYELKQVGPGKSNNLNINLKNSFWYRYNLLFKSKTRTNWLVKPEIFKLNTKQYSIFI